MEKIASSGQVLRNAVVKGATEGLGDVVSGISTGGSSLKEAFEKVKKKKETSKDDFDDFDDYEIVDE